MRLDHQMLTCKIIRANVNILQDSLAEEEIEDEDLGSDLAAASKQRLSSSRRPMSFGRLYLGSSNKSVSFRDFESAHAEDPACLQFRTRFARFLKATFPQ